ncbi:unnamed protein product [Urochloa decumbens]|uniref:Uncharacterized protein n=1 Tax=Urochloa decumbens TaxID=240449 RepID=A0ABC9BTD9_9POAL
MERKKVAKRHGGDTVDDPPIKVSKLGDGTVESSAEFAKPVYLLAALWTEQPATSAFVVDAAAVSGGDGPRRADTLAQLPGASQDMSFVSAHSEHGSWIVGVGGVYAISRRPKVPYGSKFDWLPWFESLSFNEGVPCINRKNFPFWKSLPPPPCFPYFLEPSEFLSPPDISVSSYAAVGSHILLSLEQQGTGTYAFHVVAETWEKVCDKNLPFVGQAVPLGGSLFAACCVIPNNAGASPSVFHMSMEVSSTSAVSGVLTTTLIQQFPVSSDRQVPRPILCPLGKASFCSIRFESSQSRKRRYSKGLQIIFTAFQMDNIEAFWMKSADAKDFDIPVQVKQHNQTYNIKSGSRFLASPMPVVTALSM